MPLDIIQIIIGVALFIIAIKLIKKVTKLVFFILLVAAIYCFSKGILDIGILMQWWSSIF